MSYAIVVLKESIIYPAKCSLARKVNQRHPKFTCICSSVGYFSAGCTSEQDLLMLL